MSTACNLGTQNILKLSEKNTAGTQGKKRHILLRIHTKKHGIKYNQNKKFIPMKA